ncbi:hypothetical protein JQN64_26450 [Escherichia coli]|nr:hypothetical protein [Escherichia coli]
MFLCLVGMVLGISGADSQRISVLDTDDFPSKFLAGRDHVGSFMDLMKSHFDTSLDFLFASKFYGSQYIERPGMAKLLAEESDRHWEEGMDVLKKYLQLGGVTHEDGFLDKMSFTSKNVLPSQTEPSHVKYISSLKAVMGKSRDMVNAYTDLNHEAGRKHGGNGDADVSHFLQEKAEKESEVARKMAGHYVTLQKMDASGIALGIFDKEL